MKFKLFLLRQTFKVNSLIYSMLINIYDDKIKALNITRDKVIAVMKTVGFTNNEKAKHLHVVSTLSGGWLMKLTPAQVIGYNKWSLIIS